RSVTTPPAKASAFAPIRSAVDIVRPQSKPRLAGGCGGGAGRAVAAAAGAGSRIGCGGTGRGVGAGSGADVGAATRSGALTRPARRSSTIACSTATRCSSKSTRLRRVWGADAGADRAVVVGVSAGRLEAALERR